MRISRSLLAVTLALVALPVRRTGGDRQPRVGLQARQDRVGARLADLRHVAARRHAPVRRPADGSDPHHQGRPAAADAVRRPHEAGDGRRRAGAARPRLPSGLREERPPVRLLHGALAARAGLGAARQARRGHDLGLAPAAARHGRPVLEPQRRRPAVRARRLPLHRHGRRRLGGRSGRALAERRGAARQAPADRRRQAPVGPARTAFPPTTRSRRTARGPRVRSTRGACATPGATPSIARPATSGSATSARTRGRRSTTSRGARASRPTSAGATTRAPTSSTRRTR